MDRTSIAIQESQFKATVAQAAGASQCILTPLELPEPSSHRPVTPLTAPGRFAAYPELGPQKAIPMVSRWQLNRFERILFVAALALAAVIIAVRVGAIIVFSYLHHVR
jgi:hypothetical protein